MVGEPLHAACSLGVRGSLALGPGPAGCAPRSTVAPPTFLSLWAAASDWPQVLARPSPAPGRPAPDTARTPPCGDPGDGGGGGGARRPSAGLRAARNALKRREERARAGAQASGSGERGRAEAAGGREKERVRASRERRGAGEPGTWSARTFLQSANFPGECRARLLGSGHSQREFEILGKRVGLPLSPFPFYESPLKRKQE